MTELKYLDVKVIAPGQHLGCRELGECEGPTIQITTPHGPRHTATVRICQKHAKSLHAKLGAVISGQVMEKIEITGYSLTVRGIELGK